MTEGVFLCLGGIFQYLEATPASRCIMEGEQVLNAGHIILCGLTKVTSEEAEILSLCLQTTAIWKAEPHEIKGRFRFEGAKATICSLQCSCKAGNSGRCKHISATLLKCSRSNLLDLEQLSSTDVQCYWRMKRKRVEEDHLPTPLLECSTCIRKAKRYCEPLAAADGEFCLQELLSVCPESGLAKHMKRSEKNTVECNVSSALLTLLLQHIEESLFLLTIKCTISKRLTCCRKFVDSLGAEVEAIATAAIYGTDAWRQARQFRVTGSRCYSLYTYGGDDWNKKSRSYFYPKPFTNCFVRHGLLYEQAALDLYKHCHEGELFQPGFLICKEFPWLGYSPDGIWFQENEPTRLLEVKCPYSGKTESATRFPELCKFLSTKNGISLKKRHTYYAQIQFGMALLNLQICDIILYSSYSESSLVIEVPFDQTYASSLIEKVSSNYFEYMVTTVCPNHHVISGP